MPKRRQHTTQAIQAELRRSGYEQWLDGGSTATRARSASPGSDDRSASDASDTSLECLVHDAIAAAAQGMSHRSLVFRLIDAHPALSFSGFALRAVLATLETQRHIYRGANNRYYAV